MWAFTLLSALTLVVAQDFLQDVPGGMTAQQMRNVMVDEINKLRRNVPPAPPSNMNYMYWSSELEKTAMEWARTCPRDHGGAISSGGQNMAWFNWPPTEQILRSRLYMFWKECITPGYNYWVGKSETGKWADTGHYTNQDYATNLEFACGFVNCNGTASTIVCNYARMDSSSDTGDFVEKKYELKNGTSRLFEIGSTCTGCRTGSGWCYKGLCVDKCPDGTKGTDCVCGLENHCVNGHVDSATCQCVCSEYYTGHLCDRECQNFGSNCNAQSCEDPFTARTKCAAFCGKCKCRDHGECVNGHFDASSSVCQCVCSGGWEGAFCDKCTEETCENGGAWNPETCSCDCTGEWRGKTCTLDCTVGDPNVWPCSRLEDSGAYMCSNGWYRNQCHDRCYPECEELYLKGCDGMTKIPLCKNGIFDQTMCKCVCDKGWQGDLCDQVDCSPSVLPTIWPCKRWDRTGEDSAYTCSNGWFSNQCMYNCNSECKAEYLKNCPDLSDIPDCLDKQFNPTTCTCA